MGPAAVLWFRRDLRLGDHPALLAAADSAPNVLALFVLDDVLLRPAGAPRRAFLADALRRLDERLDSRLLVVRGDPVDVVPAVAAAAGAESVHVSADFGPYGRGRDERVARALTRDGVDWVATGTPYAVPPGEVRREGGAPFRVFTPFYRSWKAHGLPPPARGDAADVAWLDPAAGLPGVRREPVPHPATDGPVLPPADEQVALLAWANFRDGGRDRHGALDEPGGLAAYHQRRDRPDLPGTSRLSAYLRWGMLHPRTLLADLAGRRDPGAETFRSELAWREFYADVLWHRPETARRSYDPRFDRAAGEHPAGAARRMFAAWCDGRTGYPIVDAGMRQLRAEGWMHNRVRMITASFLVKDLHLPWWWGARHFMRLLVDGDLASNQHGWQWVAGCGLDAAPYFRVFNPTTQAERFDPDGDYVRRYVPELRGVPGKHVHQPWLLPGGVPVGYPEPVVDHAHERRETLRRYQLVKGG